MKILSKLRQFLPSSVQTGIQRLAVVQEPNKQTALLLEVVERLSATVQGLDNNTAIVNQRLLEIREGVGNLAASVNQRLDDLVGRAPITVANTGVEQSAGTFREAMRRIPLMIDEKTYNTSHPDYDATIVRNHPGKIFNFDNPCKHGVYTELKKMAKDDAVPDEAWDQILKETLEEVLAIPDAEQLFERRTYTEQYTAELGRKYGGHYQAGWVNLNDALFLYWLIRRLKPATIVQTGVCNGLSTAFMVLALAKNGLPGKLHAVDLAPVFNPKDPDWIVKDKVYGTVIPEEKTSGWLVPDVYSDRVEVWEGDAKVLLPRLVDRLDSIDMFYHDSDHTYNHMMFEFREVKRRLRAGALIVADDISWNSSLWDFADEEKAPSYNYKGSVGVAFLSE